MGQDNLTEKSGCSFIMSLGSFHPISGIWVDNLYSHAVPLPPPPPLSNEMLVKKGVKVVIKLGTSKSQD